jgi:hypothetical protein
MIMRSARGCQLLKHAWTVAGLLFLALALPLPAASLGGLRAAPSRTSNITLRKRLHVNTLITQPGTMEIEWDNLYSFTSANFSMPSIVKYTPAGTNILWGRTEYSVAFDSIDSVPQSGQRITQFSDRVTFSANAVLHDGEKLDFAIAPQATFFLRDESGARLGATAIARYDVGRNSMGATLSWSAATSPSPTNPAGSWDFGGGFGRRLAASGAWGHLTPHLNAVYERSIGFAGTLAAFAGIEYQITERVAVDASGQRFGLAGGSPDRQIVVGLTLNLGKLQ